MPRDPWTKPELKSHLLTERHAFAGDSAETSGLNAFATKSIATRARFTSATATFHKQPSTNPAQLAARRIMVIPGMPVLLHGKAWNIKRARRHAAVFGVL
jgi:hypothetical protein